jgi:hypothetical protein
LNQERPFIIKHNDDYDSELTDHEEENDHPATNKETKKDKEQKIHRSIRLSELHLVLKAPGGQNQSYLGKHLAELILNMNNNTGTVNPSNLFGAMCKR